MNSGSCSKMTPSWKLPIVTFSLPSLLKPATHLAILYADRGEFDRQRKSQAIFATDWCGHTWRSRRCGSFEKSCDKIAQPDGLALLAIRSNDRRKSREWAHLANAGEFNRRYRRYLMSDIGDFIRWSRRSAKIAIAAPGKPGDFHGSRRSAYKIAKCVAGLKLPNHRRHVLRSVLNSFCHTGLRKQGDKFIWSDNEPASFFASDDSHLSSGDCVQLNANGSQWITKDCSLESFFVCERGKYKRPMYKKKLDCLFTWRI